MANFFEYPFTLTFRKIQVSSFLLGICGLLILSNGKAYSQGIITIQGQVSMNIAGISTPLPMQPVVINLGGTTTTLTAITDTTGFYSISTTFPVLSPNGWILVSTNCPNSGIVSNSQSYNPAITVYNIPLTCGAGGGGSTTMVLVNGALIWGLAPAPAGQLVQFYLSGSLSSVGSTMTGANGIIIDTLNLNLGTSGTGNLIAVAPCNNGGIIQDTAVVSVTSPIALFQLTCSALPVNNITVQGLVLSNTGLPMVNTPVRILPPNITGFTAITDSSGFYSATFSAPSILPGAVIMVTVLCGGPTGPGTLLTGTATYVQGITSYTVNLTCGASSARVLSISGLYLDPSGTGIAGQSVQLYHNQYNTPLRTLITTAGGFFSDTLTTTLTNGFVYAVSSCGPVPVPAKDTAFYNTSSSFVNLQLQCSSTSSVRNLVFSSTLLYPNPVKSGQELSIHWNEADFSSDKPLSLYVRDLQGKVCVRKEISPSNMGQPEEYNASFRAGFATNGLDAGIYTLELHHFSGLTKVFRLVVGP